MKRFLRFAALLSALALLGACDDDMYVTPLEVTNNNIAGTWQLAEWNGAPLAEGSFVYIEFIRKDAKYVMYYPFVSREEKMGVNIKYSAI